MIMLMTIILDDDGDHDADDILAVRLLHPSKTRNTFGRMPQE